MNTRTRTTQAGLFVRHFEIDNPVACVKIVHGIAEHSGRYEHVAAAFNAAGYSVEALDSRGHGSSPGFPGLIGESVSELIDETVEFLSSDEPAFVLAHSAGTLSVLPSVAALGSDHIRGLVISGIAIEPGDATMESLMSGGPVPADLISHDPAVVEAYISDPLVFYDRIPPETMGLAAEAIGLSIGALPQISVPTLIVHGGGDEICSPNGAKLAHEALASQDKTLKIYPGFYHEILNEIEKAEVIADIVDWLKSH